MESRYTVLERLGGGGQAEVFRGVAESIRGFKRLVAIKRVLPHLTSNPRFVAMFLDEARLSLFLQHANVVQVFDIGREADGSYYLVMEYVDGCDLKALVDHEVQNGRSASLALVLYIVIECCKGLHYAHVAEHPETRAHLGIVHRDVSPPNVMLSKSGEVKVVDFGLAKANSSLELTDEGMVKGKFSYLAPETALGLPVDPRADVFALGILLWEMLTERRLFVGDTPHETVELIRRARIPSIHAINPGVDAALEAIVRRALARERDARFQTAADLGEALSAYLFERRLKATARDVAYAVREVQAAAARSAGSPLVAALVRDELAQLTHEVARELASGTPPPMAPVAASDGLVDTKDWAADLLGEE
jgi:serine/threonine-protein kinase